MDSSSPGLMGVGKSTYMNKSANLTLYSQVLLFKNDMSREDIVFHNKSNSERRTLYLFADAQELEYEFSLATMTVRISRPAPLEAAPSPSHGYDFFDPYQLLGITPSGDNLEGPRQISSSADFMNCDASPQPLVLAEAYPDPNSFPESLFPCTTSSSIKAQKPPVGNLNYVPGGNDLESRSDSQARQMIGGSNANYSLEITPFDSTRYSRRRRQYLSMEPSSRLDGGNSIGGSRSSSVNSFQSDISSKIFAELSSTRQSNSWEASPGYKEIVFDSNSVHSGSQASAVSISSAASGRRGPLSEWARAGMNAVKKLGACWRCKFLRKTCNPQTPCSLCPRGEQSNWAAVGCNRGLFQERIPSMKLCPRHCIPSGSSRLLEFLVQSIVESHQDATEVSAEAIKRREVWLCQQEESRSKQLRPVAEDEIHQLFLQSFLNAYNPYIRQPTPSALAPLNECIMATVWELIESPLCQFLKEYGTLDNIAVLLPTAAVYQAKLESDQLIAQSLICLRSVLEALRGKRSGFFENRYHFYCDPDLCKVECIANLTMHTNLYLHELSRVFFLKENMRNKEPWWLSVFYSLCIQSVVRKALIELAVPTPDWGTVRDAFAAQYLYLPMRLFIATSGTFDPLAGVKSPKSNSLSAEHDLPGAEEYQEAQRVVGQRTWHENGIKSSKDYLKLIFEDN